ncbi:BspA family leucine-rich repeat surface protein [Winogradskyella sp.]|uniref:BspA family leucine-rich repeat surface protein n=1 Tax=Winogradskyella sp. TaxID=1883156 RepID=UPI003BA8637C
MMKKSFLFLRVISVLVLLCAFQTFAQTCETPDNINQMASDASSEAGQQYVYCQTFVPDCNGVIDQITVWNKNFSSQEAEILITQGADPTTSDVLTAFTYTFAPTSDQHPRPSNQTTIDLPSALAVTAGVTYAFMIWVDPGDLIAFDFSGGDPYPNGEIFWVNTGTTTWVQASTNAGDIGTYDMRFNVNWEGQSPYVTCRENRSFAIGADGTVNITFGQVSAGSGPSAGESLNIQSVNPSFFDCDDVGPQRVSLRVQDTSGQEAGCTTTIFITDGQDPELTCPDDITIDVDPNFPNTTIVNYDMPIVDDCTVETPDGFTFLMARDGVSYFLSEEPILASEVFAHAENLGGLVATVWDQDHNDALRAAADFYGHTEPFMIGYSDMAQEGTFAWHGADSGYENWMSSEPNNTATAINADYVTIRSVSEALGRWRNSFNTNSYRYVLELSSPTITQTEGLPSGSVFPVGETINTFETVDAYGNVGTCSFDVIVNESNESPFETLVELSNGKLTITDIENDSDDQIKISVSSDGTTLSIINLVVPTVSGSGVVKTDATTVTVPMSNITNGIEFIGGNGNNSINIDSDININGDFDIKNIKTFIQNGTLTITGAFKVSESIELDLTIYEALTAQSLDVTGINSLNDQFPGYPITITGTTNIQTTENVNIGLGVTAPHTFGGLVTISALDFFLTSSQSLELGTMTSTGTDIADTNYLHSAGEISFTDTVTTAGNSNLVIRGEFVQQTANAVITTNELTLEGNTLGGSAHLLDIAPNNVNKLTSNTTNHLVGGFAFKDADAVELGAIDTGAIFATATTFTLTETTNLTIDSNSELSGAINQTAVDSNNPAQINHNGGTLILDAASSYAFTGAFRYTAVSGATTRISNAQVLIDTPDHIQTFGTLHFIFDPFIVATGSTVNFLNKGNFSAAGTSLEGAGTIIGDVDIRNAASLNPGTDGVTGTLTINGNLELFTSSPESSYFRPFIDTDASFDALDVVGTVNLTNVDFEPTGSFSINNASIGGITLINNDGVDPIVGTFDGLAEGARVTLPGTTEEFIISYVGGDGNDLTLTRESTLAPIISCPSDITLECGTALAALGVSADTPIAIPDNDNTGIASIANVTGVNPGFTIVDISVQTAIRHTSIGDLTMEITAPGGETVLLFAQSLSDDSELNPNFPITFTDSGSTPASDIGNTIDNLESACEDDNLCEYTAMGGVDAFSQLINEINANGNSFNGDWTLSLRDHSGENQGNLVSWQINIIASSPNADPTDPVVTGTATATDTQGTPTITYSDVVILGNCGVTGTTERTWTATDADGNASTCVQTITVTDTRAPELSSCLEDIVFEIAEGETEAIITYDLPEATDLCGDATITQTEGLASGASFPEGVTTNTFSITDVCGNETICSFTITAIIPETEVKLNAGILEINDIKGGTSDDAITLSDNGTTLTISNLIAPVTVSGGLVLIDDTTVTVDILSFPSGIKINTVGGTNTVTVDTSTGTSVLDIEGDDSATIALNAIDTGSLTIEGFTEITDIGSTITVTGNTTLMASGEIAINDGEGNHAFNGPVTIEANRITITAGANITFNGVTITATDALQNFLIASPGTVTLDGNVNITDTNTNFIIESNDGIFQQSGIINKGFLILRGDGSGTATLDQANRVGTLAVENPLVATESAFTYLSFTSAIEIFLEEIIVDEFTLTAPRFDLTPDFTIITKNGIGVSNFNANMDINIGTGTAVFNHNAGTINFNGLTNDFSGRITYNGAAGTITNLNSDLAFFPMDGPGIDFTFGTLNGTGYVYAGDVTINILDAANVSGSNTLLNGFPWIRGGVSTLSGDATITPGGASFGLNYTFDDLVMNTGATFAPLIIGDGAGSVSDFDTLTVNGTITLNDANLVPTSQSSPQLTEEIIIIYNNGPDPVSGTFNGLPEGAPISFGDYGGIISYVGGDGNDVTLLPDTIDPVAVCQDISIVIDFDGVTITGDQLDGGSTDNAGIESFLINGVTELNYTYGDLGDSEVTITVVDFGGNTATCTATITLTSNAFVTTWKTDNSGSSADNQITIFTDNNETYNYNIAWGDGTSNLNVTGNITHTYSTAGTYTIGITGTFPRFMSNGSFFGDAEKLISIDQWGTNTWSSFEEAFVECENMELIATDTPNLSNVTTLNRMFDNCQSLTGNASINSWDVSNVQHMQSMFASAFNFNQPLNNWNVGNVTNMASMFNAAESFNQDLNSWNTSQVQFMNFMFVAALDFNGAIGNWNVSQVTEMRSMFSYAEAFNQDLNSWNVSQVQEMNYMFLGATNFNGNISSWNPVQVTTMYAMFQNAVNFNQDISGWNVGQVTDMEWMFNGATLFNQPIGRWDVSNVSEANGMLVGTAFSTENYDELLINWSQLTLQDDVSFGTDADYCFGESARNTLTDPSGFNWNITDGGLNCDSFFITKWKTDNIGSSGDNQIKITTVSGETYDYTIFWGDGTLDSGVTGDITHTYTTPGTYTVAIAGTFPRITTATPGTFDDTSDRLKLIEVVQWGANPWTSMGLAFTGCSNLDVTATDVPDLSNATSLSNMFANCNTLVGTSAFNNWDVSTITNMRAVFLSASIFDQDISNWNVSAVESMDFMFKFAENFNQDIGSWITNNVTVMSSAFEGATSFNQDLSDWGVGNVIYMNWMFDGAFSFDQDLGSWDISSLAEADGMFSDAVLSTENYDNTLIGWATLDAGETQIPSGITFNGGNSHYCLSQTQRQELIDTYGWSITDGGLDCDTTDYFVMTWQTDNPGDSSDTSITIPTFLGETYNYHVDWSYDGVTFNVEDANVTGSITHDYGTPGTYTVAISGTFPRIYFSYGGDRLKIQEVTQWGSTAWTSMELAFTGCEHLDITATDLPDLSQVTNVYNMLASCESLVGNSSFNAWDVSNVETMEGMFFEATNFNQDISNWNVTAVENMAYMFSRAGLFNQDINSWNVASVTTMSYMFFGAVNFNQPLNNWNVGNVTSMREMFTGATSFNQDLSGWDVGNVSDMRSMFDSALNFNQDLSSWDVGNVIDMRWMFDGAIGFDQDLGSWDISSLAMADGMFLNAGFSTENYDNTLNGWETLDAGETQIPSSIVFNGGSSQYCFSETQRQELIDSYGWTISDGGKSSICFDSNSFVTVWETTSDNESITIPTTGSGYSYNISWGDGTIDTGFTGDAIHQYATAGTYTVSIVGDFPRIYFNNNGGNRLKIREVTQWGSTAWTSMESAFRGCEHLDITATDLPDLSQVTNVRGMLSSCVSLVGNSSFNAWDVSNVETMQGMFAWTTFNQPLSNWNVSNVVYMGDMFYDATSFNQDLSGWDVGNVIDMGWMFSGATSFNQPLSNWNVSNVFYMGDMFYDATSFNQDLSDWDVGNVIDMMWMFYGATSFNQDLSDWNVGNVIDMGRMFYGATDFDQDLGSWDISSLAEADGMFANAGLSTGNYDNTLIGWATLDAGETQIPSNVNFHGGNSQYCLSELQRQELMDTYGWTITDGGFGCNEIAFITTWEVTSGDLSITIPTTGSTGYDYIIDWGDGTIETGVTGDTTHNYTAEGMYTVSIVGDFPRIYFNNGGDRLKIREVTQWGSTAWTSMQNAFMGCGQMDITATDLPDLSQVTNVNNMLASCVGLVGNSSFNAWDVTNVETMQGMFAGTAFNQPLSNWNVSNVVNMGEMFYGATSFNQPLNNWNVGNVIDMGWMFDGATSFNQDLSGWDVGNVLYMNWMFYGATSFNQPLNNWNVGNVIDMMWMFYGATSFNQPLSGWNVGNVIDMGWMFYGATDFDQDLGSWDISSLTGANEMFYNATLSTENYDSTLIGWATLDAGETQVPSGITFNGGNSHYCLSQTQRQELIDTHGWSITDGGLDCDTGDYFVMTWQTDNPGDSSDTSITIPTFLGETYNYYVDWSYDGVTFNVEDANVTGDITHDYGTPGTYTVAISGTFPRIYFDDGGDHDKILTIEQWGSIQWTSMEGAFDDCANLNITNPTIDTPDLSNVTSLKDMFSDCLSFNANIENWDVSNVEIFDEMFSTCIVFDQPLNGWAMTSATSLSYMFYEAESFNQPLNGWVTTSVTNMEGVFASALAFDQDLNNWDTSNVTSMYEMFDAAEVFNGDVSTWIVGNVEDMEALFDGAYVFNQNISGWDVSNVTNMEAMFYGAEAFNQDISGWNVSKVINMSSMLRNADDFDQNLGDWDLTSIVDTGNNSGLRGMFGSGPGGIQMSLANYDATLIGWNTDSSGLDGDGIDDIPQNINFGGGKNKYCNSEIERQNLMDTHGWAISDNGYDGSCLLSAVVSPIVYLQGTAINPNTGEESLMRDDLRVHGLLQTTSPYGDAAIAEASVFAVAGSEAIVDWVWVELRDESDNDVVIDGQSALLQRDGDVVATDGFSSVTFQQPEGSYFVVINHRNHAGIMSSTAVSLSGILTEVDLSSDLSMVQGGSNSVVLLANGRYGMYSGDYDGNTQIQNTDAIAVIQFIGTSGSGYEIADMDLNTQIQNADVNALINPNIGRGEQFDRPNAPTEQLSTDVTLAFANAQITNDGVDDYYEADIVISSTTDFYVGSGQVYLDYATAAFGENISANGNIEYSQPDGSILGYSFGAFSPAYRDFIENDNSASRVSLSFQQNVGLTGLETAPELQITSTPKVLFHIKIRYTDVSEEAGMCFYSDGIFQDQFFTACGGTATADCTTTPGTQITNDSYDCSEAGVGTLSIASFETDQILLYPNPTGSDFRIKGLSTISQIRIYDINGRLILEEQRSDDRPIDMNAYDDGVYLVKITSDSATATKRLIKKAE